LLALALSCASLQARGTEIPALLAQLDGAAPADARSVATQLVRLGEDAALLAVESPDFASRDLRARRARSWILLQAGDRACISPATALLYDEDAEVRTNALAFLSKPELRDAEADARAAALTGVAQGDSDGEVRRSALLALARIDSEASTQALHDLVLTLVAPDRRLAAAALASQPRARTRVVDLVQRAFAGERLAAPVSDDVLEELFTAYGTRLAELPQGGSTRRDRVPFSHGVRHPSPEVRRVAVRAANDYVVRLRVLGDFERADLFLAELIGEGLDDDALRLQRTLLALEEGEDPEVALRIARALRQGTNAVHGDLDTRRRHAEACVLEGVALIALGRGDEAGEPLLAGEVALEGLAAERLDLRESPELSMRQSKTFELLAVLELYRALALLGELESDDPRVLEHARAAHERSLEAHLTALRGGLSAAQEGLGQIVANPLSPFLILLANPRNPHFPRTEALDLMVALCEALATVAPTEMPGFERGAPIQTVLTGPLSDERRRLLLQQVQNETYNQQEEFLANLEKANPNLSDEVRIGIRQQRRMLDDQRRADEEDGAVAYLRLRAPSSVALVVATHLREDGRFAATRELAERMATDLEQMQTEGQVAQRTFIDSWNLDVLIARAGLTVGNALMDEDRSEDSETALLEGLNHLDVIESNMVAQGYNASNVTIMRADALVSLAVNANVKLRDQRKAVDYFERAYELRQDDFTRVLLACYRARAGKDLEARDALRDTPVIPANYYNLACTYALLGDADLALDFLRRDFEEMRATPGALVRQKEWAQKDPDLESLADDPRFQDLVRTLGR
jgi:tetratricopeptide (TPR) repeat protein